MKTTKEKTNIVLELKNLATEWLDFKFVYDNECAYTDSILELICKKAKELEEVM